MNLSTIEMLSKVPNIVQLLREKPKPGVQSTEFYVSLAVGLYGAVAPAVPAPYDVVIPVVAGSLYTAGRFLLKALHAAGLAKAVKELPELSTQTNNMDNS